MLINKLPKLNTFRSKLIIIAIIAACAWIWSVTNEFVGYDDIKLIVNNDRIHDKNNTPLENILYTVNFYWNIVSDSHNVAWTNYPSVIYRPLEWTGSSIGYAIWGPRAWCFHFFVNFNFHVLNSILLFLILHRVFGNKISEDSPLDSEQKDSEKALKKSKETSVQEHQISDWLPLVISMIWTVHPLHNEAVNMLTSGVGFLWATLFCLSAIAINLYVKDIQSLRGMGLLCLSWIFFFIGYHGAEMTLIGPLVLVIIFGRSILGMAKKRYGYEIPKILFAFTTLLTYFSHRSHIVSEGTELSKGSLAEFIERFTVLSPQVFFHYIKLFFFPANLTIDQHHNVTLENAFTPYHILCFLVALSFFVGIFYFATLKEPMFRLHNKILAGSIFMTGFGIAMSLNVFPLYVLARDRYSYFFLMGLVTSILLLLDKYIFVKWRENKDEKEVLKLKSKWLIILFLVLIPFSVRAAIRCGDWHDGEIFWKKAVDSTDDIGAKQNWRYRLVQYYLDTGTKTFKPRDNGAIRDQAKTDFWNFITDNNLNSQTTLDKYIQQSKDPKYYLKNKYGYWGNKTISSGIFFMGTESMKQGDGRKGMEYYQLAHYYFPEHYQTNLQLYIHSFNSPDKKLNNYMVEKMLPEALSNSFLAKGLMDGMFLVRDKRTYEYATRFMEIFPNTQVFTVYSFHGALMIQDFDAAYKLAKKIIKKYHEQSTPSQFIAKYEAGTLQPGDFLPPEERKAYIEELTRRIKEKNKA